MRLLGLRRTLSILVLLPLPSMIGCISPDIFYFISGRKSEIPAKYQLLEGRWDSKKILVISYADIGLKWGVDSSVDDELCSLLIGEIARKEKRFELVPERKVRDWRDRNPNWSDNSLQEIGEHFEVDYVIFLEIQNFLLNRTMDSYLLQGQTTIGITIHDVSNGLGLFEETYERVFPKTTPIPMDVGITERMFRNQFLLRIAKEISFRVTPHERVEEIATDY